MKRLLVALLVLIPVVAFAQRGRWLETDGSPVAKRNIWNCNAPISCSDDGTENDISLDAITSSDVDATICQADGTNCDATQAELDGKQAADAELTSLAAITEVEGSIIISNATPEWSALGIGGANAVLLSNATTAAWDTTPAIDATDMTNIPAASDLNDVTNVTLTTPGDGAVLCFTGTSNASVDCTLGGDVTSTEDSGTLTVTVGAGTIEETMMSTEDFGDFSCAGGADDCLLDANSVDSDEYTDGSVDPVHLANLTKSMYWGAGSLSSDGTNCSAASEVTINSGPKQWSIICTDNDASRIDGSTVLPDGWDAGNLVFELAYIQTAADTSSLEWDIYVQCRGATETVNNTWESAVNVIDAAVTGSSALDTTNSGNVTCASDAGGDMLFWKIEIDAAGTGTAMATLNIMGVKVEYVWNPAD
jgi:hypothetical protein